MFSCTSPEALRLAGISASPYQDSPFSLLQAHTHQNFRGKQKKLEYKLLDSKGTVVPFLSRLCFAQLLLLLVLRYTRTHTHRHPQLFK